MRVGSTRPSVDGRRSGTGLTLRDCPWKTGESPAGMSVSGVGGARGGAGSKVSSSRCSTTVGINGFAKPACSLCMSEEYDGGGESLEGLLVLLSSALYGGGPRNKALVTDLLRLGFGFGISGNVSSTRLNSASLGGVRVEAVNMESSGNKTAAFCCGGMVTDGRVGCGVSTCTRDVPG